MQPPDVRNPRPDVKNKLRPSLRIREIDQSGLKRTHEALSLWKLDLK